MSSNFVPAFPPQRNRVDTIRQRELYLVKQGQILNCDHRRLRGELTESISNGAAVEEGELSACIIGCPQNPTFRSIAHRMSHDERMAVEEITPVRESPVLFISGRIDVKRFDESFDETPTSENVRQSVLRRYLRQVNDLRNIECFRRSVIHRLHTASDIEYGELSVRVVQRRSHQFSRGAFVAALGQDRLREIEQEIGPRTIRRLVIRDANGQPLGWHAGRRGFPWVRVPVGTDISDSEKGR